MTPSQRRTFGLLGLIAAMSMAIVAGYLTISANLPAAETAGKLGIVAMPVVLLAALVISNFKPRTAGRN